MSNIFKAVKQALGENFMTGAQESGIVKRASQIRSGDPNISEDDAIVQALKEAYGTGIMSVNLTNQFKQQAKSFGESTNEPVFSPPSPVKKTVYKQDLGPVHNSGPLTGSDAGKPEKALSITDGQDNVMVEQKKAFEEGKTK